MEFVIAVLFALAVAAFVSVPLRREAVPATAGDSDISALEAAKEAKYREIRDLELDRAAGKIDDVEFAAANTELRAEAIAILEQTEAAEGRRPSAGDDRSG